MVTFVPATNTWAESSIHGSYAFSAKNKMWWASNGCISDGTASVPPNLYWTDDATLAVKAGPYPLDTGGLVTWLHTLGPYVLIMKEDGCVYGVDEDGVT
jgi:hypothetical protein